MNIAELLHVERLSDGALRERAGAALQPFLESAQAARPGFGPSAFYDCLRQALPAALDISLAEVIAAAWRGQQAPATGLRIFSTHNCVVDLLAGDRLLACIKVRAVVTLDVKPLGLETGGEYLLSGREALAGAELFCAGASILEEVSRPVAIPARIALTPA